MGVASTGDASMMAEIQRLAASEIDYNPDCRDFIDRAQNLAESVIANGFPSRDTHDEDVYHRYAVGSHVRPYAVKRATTSNDFRYFDLMDSFDRDFFTPFPELELALVHSTKKRVLL